MRCVSGVLRPGYRPFSVLLVKPPGTRNHQHNDRPERSEPPPRVSSCNTCGVNSSALMRRRQHDERKRESAFNFSSDSSMANRRYRPSIAFVSRGSALRHGMRLRVMGPARAGAGERIPAYGETGQQLIGASPTSSCTSGFPYFCATQPVYGSRRDPWGGSAIFLDAVPLIVASFAHLLHEPAARMNETLGEPLERFLPAIYA